MLAEKLAQCFGIASSDLIYDVPWDNLVKLFGEPIEKLTLDHELFRAFAESERWLNDAAAFLCDDFEEKYHKAANLLINYFYDIFGETVADSIIGVVHNKWDDLWVEDMWGLILQELWKKVDKR